MNKFFIHTICLFSAFFIISHAKATDSLTNYNYTGNYNYEANAGYWGQSFEAQENNISQFWFKWGGSYDGTNLNVNIYLLDNNNNILYNEIFNKTISANNWVGFTLATPQNLTIGNTYKIIAQSGTNYQFKASLDGQGAYLDGSLQTTVSTWPDTLATYGTERDMIFEIYYNPDYIQATSTIGNFKIGIAPNRICLINQPCYIYLSATNAENNYISELHAYGDGNWGENVIASTTISSGSGKITVPNSTIATNTPYTMVSYENVQYPAEIEIQNTTVVWVSSFPGAMYSTSTLNTVCDDIATSSGSLGDDIRYGLECGTRKAIYWAFVPNATIWEDVQITYNDFKNSFPFSIPYEFFNIINSVSTTTLSDDINLYAPISIGNNQENIQIMGTGLIDNIIGSSTRRQIRDIGGYAMYLILILGIAYQILHTKL